MPRVLWCLLFGLLGLSVVSAPAQERHFQENGTAVILERSAFAHGYRHGYEQGYHHGNIDANMARPPRKKMSQFKGLPLGFDSSFGSKKSFELGFSAGLQAGYGDGYAGRVFRAVSQLRDAGSALERGPALDDPGNSYFDKGMAAGYRDGFDRGASDPSGPHALDWHAVPCAQFASPNQSDSPGGHSYCEGYGRGFILGHSDALALLPEGRLLEASK